MAAHAFTNKFAHNYLDAGGAYGAFTDMGRVCCAIAEPCVTHCRHTFGTYDGGGIDEQGLPWHVDVCEMCGSHRSGPNGTWVPAP